MAIADFLNPQPAPPTPTEEASLRDKWRQWLTPDNRAALMQFGVAMLQPIARGQTLGGQIGQAVGQAGETLQARSDQRSAEATERFKNTLSAQEMALNRSRLGLAAQELDFREADALRGDETTRRGQDITLMDVLTPGGRGGGSANDLRDNYATVMSKAAETFDQGAAIGMPPSKGVDADGKPIPFGRDEYLRSVQETAFPNGIPAGLEVTGAAAPMGGSAEDRAALLERILGGRAAFQAERAEKGLPLQGPEAGSVAIPPAVPPVVVPPVVAPAPAPLAAAPAPITPAPAPASAPPVAPAPAKITAADFMANPQLMQIKAEAQAAIASGDPALIQKGNEAWRRIQRMVLDPEKLTQEPPPNRILGVQPGIPAPAAVAPGVPLVTPFRAPVGRGGR